MPSLPIARANFCRADYCVADTVNDAINLAIATAANNSSANTNAVQLLDPNADPPTVIAKLNEMLTAQRR